MSNLTRRTTPNSHHPQESLLAVHGEDFEDAVDRLTWAPPTVWRRAVPVCTDGPLGDPLDLEFTNEHVHGGLVAGFLLELHRGRQHLCLEASGSSESEIKRGE